MWYCSHVDLLHERWDLLFPVKPIFRSNSFPWFVFTALKIAPVSANRYITSLFHRAPVCSLTHFADSCTAATSRPVRLPQVARLILFPTWLLTIPVSLQPRLYLRQNMFINITHGTIVDDNWFRTCDKNLQSTMFQNDWNRLYSDEHWRTPEMVRNIASNENFF